MMIDQPSRFLWFPIVLAASCLLGGCASEPSRGGIELARDDATMNPGSGESTGSVAPRRVAISASEYRLDPNQFYAIAGESISLTLHNVGTEDHSISFETPEWDRAAERRIHPGEVAEFRLEVPRKAGEYTYFCPVGDHRDRGEVGTMFVIQLPDKTSSVGETAQGPGAPSKALPSKGAAP